MAEIETREALIEVGAKSMQAASPSLFRLEMGEDFSGAMDGMMPLPWDDLPDENRECYRAMATSMLDALDAAGIVPCPKEPTIEMMEAAVVAETDQIAAAIARSPFAKEKP